MSPVKAENETLKAENAKADTANKERNTAGGIGTRIKVGQTRGKNPTVISFEYFDESNKDSLPKSTKDFAEYLAAPKYPLGVTITPDDATFLEYLITGFNDAMYSRASDEIGEYIEDEWSAEQQSQFRLAVRNYSKLAEVSIEDAVTLIKPGLIAAFAKAKANPSPSAQDSTKPETVTA